MSIVFVYDKDHKENLEFKTSYDIKQFEKQYDCHVYYIDLNNVITVFYIEFDNELTYDLFALKYL